MVPECVGVGVKGSGVDESGIRRPWVSEAKWRSAGSDRGGC